VVIGGSETEQGNGAFERWEEVQAMRWLISGVLAAMAVAALAPQACVAQRGRTSILKGTPPLTGQRHRSTRKGHRRHLRQHGQITNTDKVPSDYTWLAQRPVRKRDLVGKSCWELRVLRNAIYAAHGYRFRNTALRHYFQQQLWYRDQGKTDTRVVREMNRQEKVNYSTIRSYEKAKSCLQ
jgi:hypothetical protein